MINNDYTRYEAAVKKVKSIKDLYRSLLMYCFLIPFFIFVNYYTFWDMKWFWFPIIGIGIGLVINALQVYRVGADWEERKIREIIQKDENN